MPTKQSNATESRAQFETLADTLRRCEDSGALFKAARGDDFVTAALTMTIEDRKALRDLYAQLKVDVDGKLRLETFDKQIIRIVGVRFWHTDKTFGKTDATGEGVTLTYHPETDPQRTCRSLTSSSVVYRFARRQTDDGKAQPSEDDPIRAYIELVAVKDAARAAEGQRVWTIQRLPMPGASDTDLAF